MRSRHDFPDLNAKSADGIKSGGKPYKVLVVENKDFQRKLLVQVLESEKYKVVAQATNGQEALDLYEEHKKDLDLITTTLDMPVIDGYALLFELSKMNVKAKIAFISEDTTKGVIEDLLKMGAADYILKPIERVRILNRIKQVLNK
ncbi:MAG: response regulator [Spirochaetes bacterium]|nr:response regulator [Spirochaetota bacterium]